jgi:hypothetical protein
MVGHMADDAPDDPSEKRSAILDVIAAIVLGVTTGFAAFGAYQSSLYGGNQATAYTEATNTLGDANRELLRGVQERSFDTTVWIEHMKAQQVEVAAAAAAPADGATAPEGEGAGSAAPPVDEEDDEEPVLTKEQLAAALADELTSVDEATTAKKLEKLLATRRELTSALKWTEEEHDKRMKALKPTDRLALATQLVDIAIQQEAISDKQAEVLVKAGVTEGTEEEIEAAFAANPAALQEMQKLETEYATLDAQGEKAVDKLSKPMFFESPAYTASQEKAYKDLVAKGQATFLEGQKANEIGDKFTLATVFMTVALFFLGLSPIMRRFPMKATFLAMGSLVAAGSTVFMFMHPLA